MPELENKSALIFGASSGIGRGVAQTFAQEGARIAIAYSVAADKSDAMARETAQLVEDAGSQATLIEADLTDIASIERAFVDAKSHFGALDIAINTAAIMVYKPVAEVSEADYDLAFGVNVKGTFFFLKSAATHIADGGRIICFSSPASRMAFPQTSMYGGTKAPIEAFVRSLAWEIGPRGVTVNAISPGNTETPMLHDDFREAGAAMPPFARLGTPRDVADIVAMVAGERGRWLTGQTIFAGGGTYMG